MQVRIFPETIDELRSLFGIVHPPHPNSKRLLCAAISRDGRTTLFRLYWREKDGHWIVAYPLSRSKDQVVEYHDDESFLKEGDGEYSLGIFEAMRRGDLFCSVCGDVDLSKIDTSSLSPMEIL